MLLFSFGCLFWVSRFVFFDSVRRNFVANTSERFDLERRGILSLWGVFENVRRKRRAAG